MSLISVSNSSSSLNLYSNGSRLQEREVRMQIDAEVKKVTKLQKEQIENNKKILNLQDEMITIIKEERARLTSSIEAREKELIEMREGRDPESIKLAYMGRKLAKCEKIMKNALEQINRLESASPQSSEPQKPVDQYKNVDVMTLAPLPVAPTAAPASMSVFESSYAPKINITSNIIPIGTAARAVAAPDNTDNRQVNFRNDLVKYVFGILGKLGSNNSLLFKWRF